MRQLLDLLILLVEKSSKLWLVLLLVIIILPREEKLRNEEYYVRRKLNKLPKRKYFKINNLLLKLNNKDTTEIDHIVVSRHGLFIIETKGYVGKINGKHWENTWTCSRAFKKNKFYNPIKQNYKHIQAIKELTGSKNIPIISIVVFPDKSTLRIDRGDNIVINRRILNKTIKKFRKKPLSKKQAQELYALLKKKNSNNTYNKRKHIKNVNEKVKNNKKTSVNRCPICNGELVIKLNKDMKNYISCSNYPKCKYTRDYR